MKKGLAPSSPTIAYYVSGHGFGHARRTAQVLRALAIVRPDVRIVIRTAAPAVLFAGIATGSVSAPAESFDPGVVERDTLTIDPAASVERLADVMNRRDAIAATEAAFIRQCRAALVVADIPFLAADAAQIAGVPSIAVGNFTWDWIFEPYVDSSMQPLIKQISDSYAKMEALYHLPLGHEVWQFRKVIEVPLLATPARQECAKTLAQLGLNPTDARPRILVALRGGLAPQALLHAAAQSPDLLFIVNQPLPHSPENLRPLSTSTTIDFSDLLAACDAIISKLGYGILSDCIANKTALLYPLRKGFREDEISQKICPQYLRMRELDAKAFGSGDWRTDLTKLLEQPPPPMRMTSDGDQKIANLVSQAME